MRRRGDFENPVARHGARAASHHRGRSSALDCVGSRADDAAASRTSYQHPAAGCRRLLCTCYRAAPRHRVLDTGELTLTSDRDGADQTDVSLS